MSIIDARICMERRGGADFEVFGKDILGLGARIAAGGVGVSMYHRYGMKLPCIGWRLIISNLVFPSNQPP